MPYQAGYNAWELHWSDGVGIGTPTRKLWVGGVLIKTYHPNQVTLTGGLDVPDLQTVVYPSFPYYYDVYRMVAHPSQTGGQQHGGWSGAAGITDVPFELTSHFQGYGIGVNGPLNVFGS